MALKLTNEEKKILAANSFDTASIESGNLDEAGRAILEEMRVVSDYLKEKYEGYNIEVTGCEPKEGTARTYNEWFFKVKEVEREEAFIARAENADGTISISDDFYGELIREDAIKEIKEILKKNGYLATLIDVSFWEYFGKEYGKNLSAADVLMGKIPAENDIKIFMDGSRILGDDYELATEKIENILKKAEIKGDIYVVFLKSADGDVIKDRLYSDSFELE